ncbi:MAG TPA: inorganic diphosphatase [Candidatus Limnocylindrales bacterium]|nr:inorganic diphosphatase [Candidatus Limnocylindrales bacterium]
MPASQGNPIDLPIHRKGLVVVVVETPGGSGNKLKYEPDLGVYRLDRSLPAGMAFPFDFGFVPQTLAEDGDPLDVIVLLDAPVYPGAVVLARMIGIIEAEQQEGGAGPWTRNDRLVAVAGGPKGHSSMRSIREIAPFRLEAIEAFFEHYHRLDGDAFRVIARRGSSAADQAIRRAHATFIERGAKD